MRRLDSRSVSTSSSAASCAAPRRTFAARTVRRCQRCAVHRTHHRHLCALCVRGSAAAHLELGIKLGVHGRLGRLHLGHRASVPAAHARAVSSGDRRARLTARTPGAHRGLGTVCGAGPTHVWSSPPPSPLAAPPSAAAPEATSPTVSSWTFTCESTSSSAAYSAFFISSCTCSMHTRSMHGHHRRPQRCTAHGARWELGAPCACARACARARACAALRSAPRPSRRSIWSRRSQGAAAGSRRQTQ